MPLRILFTLNCITWFISLEATPLALWPFGTCCYLYEVMTSSQQDHTQCGISFDESIPYSGYTFDAIALNGGTRPYFDINVPGVSFSSGLSYSDFSFRISIKPYPPVSGSVLHYRSDSCDSGITELQLWLSNGHVHASARIGSNTLDSMSTVWSGYQMTANSWQFLALGVEASTGYLVIMVHSNTFIDGNKTAQMEPLRTPGTLRLGGTFDDSVSLFSGGMTCLGLYEELLDSNNAHDYSLSNCMHTTIWNSWPQNVPTSTDPDGCTSPTGAITGPADRTKAYFYLVGNNMAPSCFVASSGTSTVLSSLKCSIQCLQDDSCLSYSVTTSGSSKTCTFYDDWFNSTSNLVSAENTKYYIFNF